MPRVLRYISLGFLVVLLQAGGCDDESPQSRSRPSPNPSASSSPPDASTSPSLSPSPTDSTARLSAAATRTGVVITRDGQPIDAVGLAAIGWTKVDPATGQANWSDPTLGTISVTWDVPDARALCCFDVSFWGDVTGSNLAMGPVSVSATVFTFAGSPETSAHSTGGLKAEAPTRNVPITVPGEQPVGTPASLSFNLGFPQPVLVTYNYVYE